MSGHSSFQSNNAIINWIEYRLPIFGFINDSLVVYPTPKNLNYWWNMGSLAGVMLVLQIVTGIILAMHYTPHADLAFASTEHIMRDVNYGWMMRYMHANGGSMFFIVVYIHIFRGMYYGSYKAPRELLWWLGIIIFILMMATAFMGYVLPWGQMSFWGATVITNLFSAVPLVGEEIVAWLWGGFAVAQPTLNRFYSLHYLLPFVIFAVVFIHLWALHVHKSNNPLGIDIKGPQDTIPFHPYYTVKDLYGMGIFGIIFAWLLFFAPNLLGEPSRISCSASSPCSLRCSFCSRCPGWILPRCVRPASARYTKCCSGPSSLTASCWAILAASQRRVFSSSSDVCRRYCTSCSSWCCRLSVGSNGPGNYRSPSPRRYLKAAVVEAVVTVRPMGPRPRRRTVANV